MTVGPYAYDGIEAAVTGFKKRFTTSAKAPYSGNPFRYGNLFWQLFGCFEPDEAAVGGSPQPNPKPLVVYAPGGQNTSHVGSSASAGYLPLSTTGGSGTIFEAITKTAGCFLVTVERCPGTRLNEILDVPTMRDVFQRFKDIQLLVRHLKENATNEEYWGVGNSIDPNKIILAGNSQGAFDCALAAIMPPLYPDGGGGNDGLGGHYTPGFGPRFTYGPDHYVRALYLDEPFIDPTQVSNESSSPGGDGLPQMHSYFGDHNDWYGGETTRQTVEELPYSAMYAMSIHHWLATIRPRYALDLMICAAWNTSAQDPTGWTYAHGVRDSNCIDPHDHVQAQPFYDLLVAIGMIDQTALFANQLSEVWLPAGAGGESGSPTAAGDIDAGSNTKIVVFTNWLMNKVIPNL